MQRKLWIAILVIAVLFVIWQQRAPDSSSNAPTSSQQSSSRPEISAPNKDTSAPDMRSAQSSAKSYPDYLPDEALDTIALIEDGGPFPHRKDGVVFQNRERQLPQKPRGYYHEYTVETPGSRDRGARRIVTGGEPVETYCYTEDHYRSFRCFEARP